MPKNQSLQSIRKKIDALDEKIQQLINERADCAAQIAQIKSLKPHPVIHRPKREAKIFQHIRQRQHGLLSADDMVEIFMLILAKSRTLQTSLAVAKSDITKKKLQSKTNSTTPQSCADSKEKHFHLTDRHL